MLIPIMGATMRRKTLFMVILLYTASLVSIPVLAETVVVSDEDYGYGNFSWAYAYVEGWYEYGPPIPEFYYVEHDWDYGVDSDYPYGIYDVVMEDGGGVGYPYAWTKTEVWLYNAYGEPFEDSEAYAYIDTF